MSSSSVSSSLSKMLNSPVGFGVQTLRRFAEGLPRDAWSRFMIPSLRFRGLTVEYEPNVPLRRLSMRDRVGRGPSPFSAHDPSIGWSAAVTSISGVAGEFSSPDGAKTGCSGFALP